MKNLIYVLKVGLIINLIAFVSAYFITGCTIQTDINLDGYVPAAQELKANEQS